MRKTLKEQASKITSACSGKHEWQPSMIAGYFVCSRCHEIAACVICAPKLRGSPKQGYCKAHAHLRSAASQHEVLS